MRKRGERERERERERINIIADGVTHPIYSRNN
jgi:hypothetical protein